MTVLVSSLPPVAHADIAVRPVDTGVALNNPGMGWVLHFYDNDIENYGSRLALDDPLDDFPGLTTIYLRLPWAYLEPQEGEFSWSVLDAVLQRWRVTGRKVAFRFTCCETGLRFATPEWVRQAGATGHEFIPRWGGPEGRPCWEPNYEDPIFLDKLSTFLRACGNRYDGRSDVAFVDVGSFGVWGEGHTSASTHRAYSADTVITHIDLHRRAFPRTLLAANDDFADHGRGPESLRYAFQQGLTLRDDSVLVERGDRAYHSQEAAQAFWPTRPVILESQHYGISRDEGIWGDGGLYLQAVEEYHASYASIHWWPREFLAENRDLVARMNQRLGYRIQLTEAHWPSVTSVGGNLHFRTWWRNGGVAPCLPGGFPTLTLKDRQGGIAGVFVAEGGNVATLPVISAGESSVSNPWDAVFRLPGLLGSGTYDVFVSVGDGTGTPTISLPLPEDDGECRYRLGCVSVQERTPLVPNVSV